jgi:epoxyqueuosine reductase QueG
MDTIKKVYEAAGMLGTDFFGIADLSPAYGEILRQGGEVIASYPLAISVGITLLNSIVDQLPQRSERAVAINYLHHSYNLVNHRLDLFTSQVSSLLQREGYRALPIPAARRVNTAQLEAAFSHKLAAHLAGLGWIGKSCLLVTPQAGPRVRWATILTDTPLQATGMAMQEQCGSCAECVEICPVQAFTGEPFRAGEPREKRYDASKCDRYFTSMKNKDLETAVCGMCLYICPHGRK